MTKDLMVRKAVLLTCALVVLSLGPNASVAALTARTHSPWHQHPGASICEAATGADRAAVPDPEPTRRRFLSSSAAAAVAGWVARPSAGRAAPELVPGTNKVPLGTKAPAFDLPSTSGSGRLSLAGLSGRWVVLYFYPADFSTGCTLEANRFQLELPKFRALGAEVIGVSVDDLDRHRDFCDKAAIEFPLLSDTEGKVSFAYGSLLSDELGSFAQRQSFLIDPKGELAFAWRSVAPAKHAREVRETLEELQAKQPAGKGA